MRWGRTIAIIFLCWAGFIPVCFAAVSLSVNAIDSSDSSSKEIQIHVTSNQSHQYQVFQRVIGPIDAQAVDVQTLAYSNASGTLEEESPGHLSGKDQLLYTSSPDGQEDSFVVRYSLNPGFVSTDGKFTSKIIFSLRLMDQPVRQQVRFDLSLENASALNISVKGGRDPQRVSIRDSDTTTRVADFVKISFSGNTGEKVRVYQELEVPLKNEMGHQLSTNVLRTNGRPLKDGKVLVYSSTKGEDNFFIYFLVDPNKINEQDAGFYTGKITYVLATNQVRQGFSLGVQCAVQPVFTMDVSEPYGGVVTLMVTTNLHRPYQVLQSFQKMRTNEKGKAFNAKHFLMKVEIPPDEQGVTDFADFSPVKKGEYPVFSSDAQGSPVELRVVYRLEGYDKMDMGHFLAPIKFSLNQK